MKTAAQETALLSSERLLQSSSGGRSACKILVKGSSVQSSACFTKGFRKSQGADVTVKGFSSFLDMRRCKDWDHEISSWKYLAVEGPDPLVSLEHRVPHSPPWIPPRGCWRSEAAATQGSVSAESDRNTLGIVAQSLAKGLGKCQFVVDRDDEKPSKTDWTVETYQHKKKSCIMRVLPPARVLTSFEPNSIPPGSTDSPKLMANPPIGSAKGPENREEPGKESPRIGGSTFVQLLSPEHPMLWLHSENMVLTGHGHI